MDASGWFFVIWGLLTVVAFIVMGNKNDKIKSKATQLHQKIDNLEGFKASHCLIKFPGNRPTWIPDPIGIAIDDESKQVCLINGELLRLIRYGDIIESEIIAGGATITKTSRTSQLAGAAVGGLLLGGIGAVIGGVSGTKVTSQDVKDVWLKLLISDTSNPVHLIDFIEGVGVDRTVPKVALQEAQKWHDLISVIIKEAEKKAESNSEVQPITVTSSIAEQFSQLSELHKTGALTDDEFTNVKNKVLS